MADSENIKEVVNQVVMQAEMTVIMALRDVEAGPQLITDVSHSRAQ